MVVPSVDSIMGIEIAARAGNNAELDLVPSFMIEYPTIRDPRVPYARPQELQHSDPNLEPFPTAQWLAIFQNCLLIRVQRAQKVKANVKSPADDDSPTPIEISNIAVRTFFKRTSSSYLHCPGRPATGRIEGTAMYIIEALLQFQTEDIFSTENFSGGDIVG
ncbi:hypothetical protein BKA66DRAFT_448308 [Pyrenochaeta sp. MPI-SDFR-AT-0127]|nr:hypothetical protein BKA66DRAFT_448308 [Pyrenochaeta sp. MPI-SDFR-AT-0127]